MFIQELHTCCHFQLNVPRCWLLHLFTPVHPYMHILHDNIVYTQACWCCSPSRSVSDSSIIITIQKVKHSASSLFFVIYAFVLLPLFTLISICKSNHTASPSQLLVLSGQNRQPTGNSLCKYTTVDTRWAEHSASLLWLDTLIKAQIRTGITLAFLFNYCHHSSLSTHPSSLIYVSYLQEHF